VSVSRVQGDHSLEKSVNANVVRDMKMSSSVWPINFQYHSKAAAIGL